MDSRIKELKEKYWAGETSPAEERELKGYFSSHASPDAEAKMFRHMDTQKKTGAGRPFTHPGRKIRTGWFSAAAAAIILITAGIFVWQNDTKSTDQYAVKDPQEAYEITRASLIKISEGLNKGKTYTYELKKINKAKETITY
ncbi:MAG: hypothetical protein P8100_04085 [bacterium]